ncbi:PH domain-containing protein [Rehaibacterium terrae]|jgi:hypothetical protein|uniref:Bacterial Pleckstrin homology domain-containing protein n=1 Tax=Rehaibacterium terrae TaxID=1341696 RepID=A0A7W7V6P2_9GAMM|nr:PH domain-containing protein [Rehaibacterium terrae]MBB5014249.1 hypothetical protein [Rehaibacterium terrae]
MKREFALAPTGKLPWLFLAGLLGILPMLLIAVSVPAAAPGSPQVTYAALALTGFTALGIFALARRRSVAIEGDRLVIRAALYTQRIPLAELCPEQARIVDLREHHQWRPALRSNGLGLPGLKLGHFRSRGLGKLFCVLTDASRVLVLPERGGRALLLSLERPQALLDALRAR